MADLHYKLLSILSLICYKSDYYCFCDKYERCEKDYPKGRDLCLLCCIKVYFRDDLMNNNNNNNNDNNNNNNNITFILMKEVLQSHMSYRLFTPHQ